MKIHIVQKGDTLWKIAKKYGVQFEELKKMNTQLSNPDMIMPGMKIKVPTSGGTVTKEAPISTGSAQAIINMNGKKEMQIKEQPMKMEQITEMLETPKAPEQPKAPVSEPEKIQAAPKPVPIPKPAPKKPVQEAKTPKTPIKQSAIKHVKQEISNLLGKQEHIPFSSKPKPAAPKQEAANLAPKPKQEAANVSLVPKQETAQSAKIPKQEQANMPAKQEAANTAPKPNAGKLNTLKGKEAAMVPYSPKMPTQIIPDTEMKDYYVQNMTQMEDQLQQTPVAFKKPQAVKPVKPENPFPSAKQPSFVEGYEDESSSLIQIKQGGFQNSMIPYPQYFPMGHGGMHHSQTHGAATPYSSAHQAMPYSMQQPVPISGVHSGSGFGGHGGYPMPYMPQQAGSMNAQMPMMQGMSDNQMPMMQGVSDNQMPMMQGMSDNQMPMMQGMSDNQMPMMQGMSNAQLPHTQNVHAMNTQMPLSQHSYGMDAQMPAFPQVQGSWDAQMPLKPETGGMSNAQLPHTQNVHAMNTQMPLSQHSYGMDAQMPAFPQMQGSWDAQMPLMPETAGMSNAQMPLSPEVQGTMEVPYKSFKADPHDCGCGSGTSYPSHAGMYGGHGGYGQHYGYGAQSFMHQGYYPQMGPGAFGGVQYGGYPGYGPHMGYGPHAGYGPGFGHGFGYRPETVEEENDEY